MRTRFLSTALVTLILTLHMSYAAALTMRQVSDICHSSAGQCSDNPIIRAYVGGALDLLATLDERTNYLKKIVCKNPRKLFDVPAIIRYMEHHSKQYAKDNAMLVLVRYFEERGGCKQ